MSIGFILNPEGKSKSENKILYGLLSKREVKMVRCWPSSFLPVMKVKVHKATERNEANILPS